MKSILALWLAVLALGCGGGGNGAPDARTSVDGGVIDASHHDAPIDADCVENPVTNAQLMNACTDSDRIDKNPTTGCWDADGELPDLP